MFALTCVADSAQRDLAEALPALDAALASLKSLNKNDVVEVRAMTRPPGGVIMVIEATCIMKGIKPKRVAGDKVLVRHVIATHQSRASHDRNASNRASRDRNASESCVT